MSSIDLKKLTYAGFLISIGIVFGDIGTSPLYTYTAIIGDQTITELLALGGVSAIFWTLTFQTTIKYVFITLRADNKGEGGMFSLYTLIRKYRRWLLFPAIAGGSFLLADSIITPPISVSSAMEGRKVVEEMVKNKEVNINSRYCSLDKHNITGDFRFVVTQRFLSFENELSFSNDLILKAYFLLKKISLADEKEFGLDYSNVTIEKSPLILNPPSTINLVRE